MQHQEFQCICSLRTRFRETSGLSSCIDTALIFGLQRLHFTPDCFTRRIDLIDASEDVSKNRHLINGSVPTIDAAIEQQERPVSTDRERRMVSVECNVDLLEYRSIQ